MPRLLISMGYIPDTPINRFCAEWAESAGLIYAVSQMNQPLPEKALIGGGVWTVYDAYVRSVLK